MSKPFSLELLLGPLARQLPGVVYRCALDRDWTMHYMSPGIEALSGYPVSDFLFNRVRTYASLIHAEDRIDVERGVAAGVRSGQAFDLAYRIVTAQGQQRWVHERGCAVRDEDGGVRWLDGMIMDSSATQPRLHQCEALVQRLPLSLITLDDQQRVLSWNDGAESLFGWRAAQVMGRSLSDFLLRDPDTQQGFERQLASGGGASAAPWPSRCTTAQGQALNTQCTVYELPSLPPVRRTLARLDLAAVPQPASAPLAR